MKKEYLIRAEVVKNSYYVQKPAVTFPGGSFSLTGQCSDAVMACLQLPKLGLAAHPAD